MKKILIRIILITSIIICQSTQAMQVYNVYTVDDEIITNLDLENEKNYIKILNKNFTNLTSKQQLDISKKSLINEIIKKKEVLKVSDNAIDEEKLKKYLNNFYQQLNINGEKEFELILKENKTYSLEQFKNKVKIELLWGELIYSKYINLININKKELLNKLDTFINEKEIEYLLSEIVFQKNNNETLDETINKINMSIKDIGFNNTASIFSKSDSSKFGGNLGWVSKSSLSKTILDKIKNMNEDEISELIKIGNDLIYLKIEKKRIANKTIDKEKELQKLIQFETQKQLNKYAKIFFDKIFMNYLVNEK